MSHVLIFSDRKHLLIKSFEDTMAESEEVVARDIPLKGAGIKIRKRKVQINGEGSGGNGMTGSQLLNHASHLKKAHMNQMRKRKRDFLKRIHYENSFTVIVLPLLAFIYLFKYAATILPGNSKLMIFAFLYHNITLLAFTSGYHKLFTHNTFRVRFRIVALYFAVFGSSIGLGSIREWASNHRAHHQFTDDTDKDPYLIKRGFLWAQWGWLIKKPKISTFYEEFIEQEFPSENSSQSINNEVEQNDELTAELLQLTENDYNTGIQELIRWQNRYYFLLFLFTTVLVPGCVSYFFCNDTALNGIIYAGILRMFLCQQSLLSVESICHMKNSLFTIPCQPFNDKNSSQDCLNPIISILTYGQAMQNYHHEFPHDYRSSSSIFAFDPTKWFIWTLSRLLLIEDLCVTPGNLIDQLEIQQQQLLLNRQKSQLNWGTPISKLPQIAPKEFKKLVSSSENRVYIVIQNIIHDITQFMDQHPGGAQLIKASQGKDATHAFYGGVYRHLTAAINLLATMRIGILKGNDEEDLWKRVVNEEGEVYQSVSRNQDKHYRTAEAA